MMTASTSQIFSRRHWVRKSVPVSTTIGAFRRFQINRSARAVVARIARAADGAIAANHRHALRSAGAEESEGELRVESWRVESPEGACEVSSLKLSTLNSQLLPSLSLLRIKNLALVEDLEWNLQPGFTAITGETGAGKSIIIGALKLLLGERADKSLIRTGAEACTVEAIFAGENFSALNRRLNESGVEPCAMAS